MKAVIGFSGGADSAVALAMMVKRFGREEVLAVQFVYGAKNEQAEMKSAAQVCEWYGVELERIVLAEVFKGFGSSLLKGGGEVREGRSTDEVMKDMVVPGRNTIFVSVLAGIAEARGMEEVWMGIHSGAGVVYPDCRESWEAAMGWVVREGSDGRVTLQVPFIKMNKVGIVWKGNELGVPWEVTRSCFKDQQVACGKCGTCQARLEAFAANGLEDPLEYESREILPKE